MSEFEFTKSTYSSGEPHGECVEVARNIPTTIAIRDSKQANGPLLQLTPTTWTAFTAHVGAV
ncbi:DUF397 domain-containing protein [Streptomyces prunicolor]